MDNNKRLKEIELKILKTIINICEENNLRYYLAYGTLLGTIRHKGFIPWDDDIDIAMPLEDLLKLKQIFINNPIDNYYFQDKLTDKFYYNYWPKIGLKNTTWMPKGHIVDCKYGICIDIFPMFLVKDNDKSIKKFKHYYKLLNISTSKYYVLNQKEEEYKKYKILFHKLVPNYLNNILYKYAIKKLTIRYEDGDKVYVMDKMGEKNMHFFRKELFKPVKMLFEDRKYNVPVGYDDILKMLYNDYMIPPKEEDRYGHDIDNNSIIYDFEKSYTNYFKEKSND